MATLKWIAGPVRISSMAEIVDYVCTRCGATLELSVNEWGPDTWRHTPKPAEQLR
jgi:hypothetical protein